jgi:hypothetical protein
MYATVGLQRVAKSSYWLLLESVLLILIRRGDRLPQKMPEERRREGNVVGNVSTHDMSVVC